MIKNFTLRIIIIITFLVGANSVMAKSKKHHFARRHHVSKHHAEKKYVDNKSVELPFTDGMVLVPVKGGYNQRRTTIVPLTSMYVPTGETAAGLPAIEGMALTPVKNGFTMRRKMNVSPASVNHKTPNSKYDLNGNIKLNKGNSSSSGKNEPVAYFESDADSSSKKLPTIDGMILTPVVGGYTMKRIAPLSTTSIRGTTPAVRDNTSTPKNIPAVKDNTLSNAENIPATSTSPVVLVNNETLSEEAKRLKKLEQQRMRDSLKNEKAQRKAAMDTIPTMKDVVLEFGGPGLAITGNFESRLKHRRDGFGYSVGAGYFWHGGNNVFTVPIQLNYLKAIKSGYLEFGAGTTFLNSHGDNTDNVFIFDKVTGFIGTATIGYRYQPTNSKFNFRISFVPLFSDEGITPAGGIGIGYNIK